MPSNVNTALLAVIENLGEFLKPHHKPEDCLPEDPCLACRVNSELLLICADHWEREGDALDEKLEQLMVACLPDEPEPMRKYALEKCRAKIDDLLSTFADEDSRIQ